MKRWGFYAAYAAIIASNLVCHCLSAQAAQAEFTCQIRLRPQTIAVYEPLRIEVMLKYSGTTPRRAGMPFDVTGPVGLTIKPLTGINRQTVSLPGYALYTDAFVDAFPPNGIIPVGASHHFPVMAVYDWHGQRFLFEQSGTYQVTIIAQISVPEDNNQGKTLLVRDEQTLEVKDYTGKDKELWKQIVLSRTFARVFSGQALTQEDEQKLRELTEPFPQSPYRPYALALLGGAFHPTNAEIPEGGTASRQADFLQTVIAQYPRFAWRDHAAARLYRLLMNLGETERAQEVVKILFDDPLAPPPLKYQIENFRPSTVFPQDKRLDQKVTYEYPKQTPLSEVLIELSRQTGVPLSLHPGLTKRSRSSLKITESLRETMLSMSVYKSQWIRDGNGYKLVPKGDSTQTPTPTQPQ